MTIAPPPRTDRLVIGGRSRRRRRDAGRLGLAAASVVLLGSGVLAATQLGEDEADPGPEVAGEPTGTAAPSPEDTSERTQVGRTASGLPIVMEMSAADAEWFSGDGVVPDDDTSLQAGLGVFQPLALAGGSSACTDDGWEDRSQAPAATAATLARQLERLPGSTVAQGLTPSTAYGYGAHHLSLVVDNACPSGQAYKLAEAPSDFGLSYSADPTLIEVDLLVVDVAGTPIVVALWNERGAPADLVEKATEVRNHLSLLVEE